MVALIRLTLKLEKRAWRSIKISKPALVLFRAALAWIGLLLRALAPETGANP